MDSSREDAARSPSTLRRAEAGGTAVAGEQPAFWSCRLCAHSASQLSLYRYEPELVCMVTGERAKDRCDRFTYEPGTQA